jgi:acyl carrier protein
MQKKNLENEVKTIIKRYRKIQFSTKDDLYKKGIVDSFDILTIIEELEKKFFIKLNFAKDSNFTFSVSYIAKKIELLKKK